MLNMMAVKIVRREERAAFVQERARLTALMHAPAGKIRRELARMNKQYWAKWTPLEARALGTIAGDLTPLSQPPKIQPARRPAQSA